MTIAYDAVLRRPGCALIQAAFGATIDVSLYFDSKVWLLSPTPDMRLYEVTPEQLAILVKL